MSIKIIIQFGWRWGRASSFGFLGWAFALAKACSSIVYEERNTLCGNWKPKLYLKFTMFAVRNKFINDNGIYSLQTKSLYKKGIREFKKLNSFPSFHYDRFVTQRVPILFNQIFFKMRNSKKTKPSKEQLTKIKTELEALNPQFKKLKVKPYYYRVRAHASIGCRRVFVRGSVNTIIDKFTEQYLERLPTAFTNLKTI